MKQSPHTLPPTIINLFFIIGLISALSFRSLMALKDFAPDMLRPIWYLGIIGYILFFSFRYTISQKRRKTIIEYDLISKVKKGRLNGEERQALAYLLASLQKSRENLNYLFIFVTSGLAILFDLIW